MKNQEIANILYQIAIYLEMDDIPFKPQAYNKAGLALETLTSDVKDLYFEGGKEALKKIPGIGENLAQKIIEYLQTGKIQEYENHHRQMPVKINELIQVEGVGPKMIKALYQNLKIVNLADLEKAAKLGKLKTLPNFGIRTEQNIIQAIEFLQRSQGRFLLSDALFLAEDIIGKLKKIKEIDKIVYAGSLRRMKETIGDIDLLAVIKKGAKDGAKKAMDAFVGLSGIVKVWDYGLAKSSVRFEAGIDADLRVVDGNEFGSALQYFTGSKEHNIAVRKIALDKGLKLSEYGVFKKAENESQKAKVAAQLSSSSSAYAEDKLQRGSETLSQRKRGIPAFAGMTSEESVYETIGLPYIEPELRENAGEIEAALRQGHSVELSRSSLGKPNRQAQGKPNQQGHSAEQFGLELTAEGLSQSPQGKPLRQAQGKPLRQAQGKPLRQAQGKPNQLPKIIGYNEIKGDLHCHSNWDGGENSIEEMAEAAKLLGYQYLGISDHTKFLRIENGLDEKQLLEQHKEIERLNRKIQDTRYKIQDTNIAWL